MNWKIMLILNFATSPLLAKESQIRQKRNVVFLPGSAMGLYLALALPIDLSQYELSMSFNYEANYLLPSNVTELALGPYYTEIRKARSLTREKMYSFIEDQFESRGFTGKECLLRAICETQANPILGHNGLIGDILHILFTPSTTEKENLSLDYEKAEELGRNEGETCGRLYENCPLDLYDLFSIWSH